MTNKKLKMAAMSVALTACVAASPLAANADAPEAAPEKKEPVAEETKKEENTAEPQDNKQSEKAQETLKDAEVKYDKENPTTNPDGSQKLDGVIVTNPEGSGETGGETNPNPGSGETDPNPDPEGGKTDPNPDPDSGETAPEEKKSEEKKPEEKEPEEKKPEQIGTAEKTEKSETNVETKPNPGAEPIVDTTTPPTVEKNPDGSTTITQPTVTPGTETTTTTGSGEATGNLHEKKEEVKKEDINLDKELGKKPDISWNIEKGADAVNGYKVEEVTNSDDGNKQTLKLRKEEETTAEMTAEDIAKLVDAEKPTVNPDGTYTLTRTETVLDAEGNPQTRTTYITIQDNKVTTKTTTELTITREKEKQEGNERVDFEVKYPEITVTNQEKPEDTQTISRDLLDTILSQNPKEDGSYEYTDGDGRKYEVKVDGTAEKLNNAEIVERLKQDGHTEYTLGADGEIYYKTEHGETVKLDVTQNQLLRQSLTYTVTLTTTKKGDPGTAGEQNATENARRDATRDALTKAVDKLGVDEATAAQLKAKISGLPITKEQLDKGDTFEVTLEDGTKYTLTYSAAGAEVTASTPTTDKTDTGKKPEDITDVKDNTVTGTAYVTGSKITYQAGAEYKTTGVDTLGIGADFKTAPKDADPDSIQTDPNTGRITSYKDKDGKTHSFEYDDNVDLEHLSPEERAELDKAATKNGWTTKDLTANLTRVRWTVKSPDTTKPKTTPIENGTPVDLSEKTWSSQNGNNGTVDFTHGNKTYAGMTKTAEDGKTKTYKKTEANGTVTIITVTTRELTEPEIRAKFGNNLISLNLDDKTVTYTGKDGKTYTASYVAQEEKLTVEVQKPQAVAATGSTEDEAKNAFLVNLEKARQDAAKDGETLVIEYKDKETGEVKYLTVTKETKWEDITHLVGNVVNYNAMTDAELVEYLKKLETTAKKDGKYYDGSTEGNTPYYWDANNEMMKRVPKGVEVETEYQYVLGVIPVKKHYAMINGARHEVHYNDNDIEHLDLATDSKLTLSEKEDGKPKTDDCVLVNPKLEWNYSAENLLADQNTLARENRNKNVGLDNKISYDKSGHYEYERGKNKHPDKSAFYKVTGTVAYDAVKENGKVKLFTYQEEAVKAYLTAVEYGKTYEQLNEKEMQEILSTYVVQLGPTRNNFSSPKGYHVYKKSSTMTAYGYMSDDNNTCGNALFEPGSKYNYVGGYDLTLGNLTQTDEKHVVAMGKNTTALSATFKRRKLENLTNRELRYTPISETVTVVTPGEETTGSELSGSYSADYTKTVDYTDKQQKDGIAGTGEGHYKSFTNLIRNIFNGDGKGTVEGGFIKYEYHTEKDKEGNPVPFEADKMVVTTKQDAEVHYTFTSQESRDVWIKGYTQTVVPPVNPGPDSPELPPVEDAKPAPAPAPAPETPVLPVVQDARPDPAPAPAPAPAPETPVLPAVQDAKLIQTGTSGWLADLMLGAGMVLSAAGYWMERKRKAMFYKSQH